jgi:hypothetical protein
MKESIEDCFPASAVTLFSLNMDMTLMLYEIKCLFNLRNSWVAAQLAAPLEGLRSVNKQASKFNLSNI